MDGATVDRIIETTPNDARYFVGMMVWAPGTLDEEIKGGAWQVRAADVNTAMPSRPTGLWKSLGGTEV